jgi:hypothetical protein
MSLLSDPLLSLTPKYFRAVTLEKRQSKPQESSPNLKMMIPQGEYKANILCYASGPMDEGRKRVLLIAASILAARKLAQYEQPCPAIEAAISNSISLAERIMAKIDSRFPDKPKEKPPYAY